MCRELNCNLYGIKYSTKIDIPLNQESKKLICKTSEHSSYDMAQGHMYGASNEDGS